MTAFKKLVINYNVTEEAAVPVEVEVKNGEISLEEASAYVDRGFKNNPEKIIDRVIVSLDGEFVDLQYHFSTTPFERIRRITGYLVGTLDRFNNAKRAEVGDRVKHGA